MKWSWSRVCGHKQQVVCLRFSNNEKHGSRKMYSVKTWKIRGMICLSQKPTDSSGASPGLLVITHSERQQIVAGEGSHAQVQAALFRDKCPCLAPGHEHNTAHSKHRDEAEKGACAVKENAEHLRPQNSSWPFLERSERTDWHWYLHRKGETYVQSGEDLPINRYLH